MKTPDQNDLISSTTDSIDILSRQFQFDGSRFRVLGTIEKPLFVATDVCAVLGIEKHRDAISRLDADERGSVVVDTPGGAQTVSAVTESGLYQLVFKSRKDSAKRFAKWVTSEILPAIRKTGTYETPNHRLPTSFSEALRLAADQAEVIQEQSAQLAIAAPKIEFYDTVTESDSVCQMAVVAQVAKLPFGRNTLFQKLRQLGVLITGGERHNMPKQQYVTQGLFTVNQRSIEHPKTGEPIVIHTTYATQKGLAWIISKFNGQEEGLV